LFAGKIANVRMYGYYIFNMDRNRRRRFGQNFLDDRMAQAIAGDLPIAPGERILEIGPGHGAMTRHLLGKAEHVTAVEIDPECAELVSQQFAGRNFNVIKQDFLQFHLVEFCAQQSAPFWAVGNLPYNVGTAILVRLIEQITSLRGVMAMVQYEVAERLCADPGTSAYGSLTVFVAAHCDRQLLRKVGPEHFTPRPNVDSATVLLTPARHPLNPPHGFFEFVSACFTHKRKRLANSLVGPWEKPRVLEAISQLGWSDNVRAEELSPEQFVQFFQILHQDNT